jgi:predicted adenine nucleotide alpha hydrolase (AANH) superfamily ATPase
MKPRLLLHACCAPCFTTAEERLRDKFRVEAFWYNPNIHPEPEHALRLRELERYAGVTRTPLRTGRQGEGEIEKWDAAVVEYRDNPEGQRRCRECIFFRLWETATVARQAGFSHFATTLTVSRQKSALVVNAVGQDIAEQVGIQFLAANFKKQDGNLRSQELSRQHNLYRQQYCGCRYSLAATALLSSTDRSI